MTGGADAQYPPLLHVVLRDQSALWLALREGVTDLFVVARMGDMIMHGVMLGDCLQWVL